MLKRHFGLVDAIVDFKLISHMWPLLPPECFLCDCCHCAPSLPTTCCPTRIRSGLGLHSASPTLLQDSAFQVSPLLSLGFHGDSQWALMSSLWHSISNPGLFPLPGPLPKHFHWALSLGGLCSNTRSNMLAQ